MIAAAIANKIAATTPAIRVHSANVDGMLVIRSDADQRATPPPKDAAAEARRVARQEQAFAGDEHKKARSDKIAPLPCELDGQQSGGDDKRDAVDCPKRLSNRVLRHKRAGHAEDAPNRQADRGDDIDGRSHVFGQTFPPASTFIARGLRRERRKAGRATSTIIDEVIAREPKPTRSARV